MTARIAAVTFDCEHACSLAEFWSQVIGRPVSAGPPEPNDDFASIAAGDDGTPMMMFLRVPEGKSAKNRVHLDLAVEDRGTEVARLLSIGATHLYDKDEWGLTWSTFCDPEGNEFCVSEHLA